MELGSPVDRQCDQAEDLFAAMPVYDEEEDDDPIAAGYERFPPNCAVCKESLVMWGGPVSLSCGHSLCLECLRKAQTFSSHPLLCPLCKEIEEWVPVSVPPMDIDDYEKGLYENGCDRVSVSPDKKLGALFTTMRKMVAGRRSEAKKSRRKQSLYAMTSFLEDVQVMKAVFEAEPPEWLPDSSATSCMQCSTSFKALSCGRHHCRFCGQIFCGRCSSARSLLPSKFRVREPQRVCDTCASALEPGQTLLALQVSHAFQTATHDVTDASCLRSWLNSPLGLSMEHEIYKATNTLRHFLKRSGWKAGTRENYTSNGSKECQGTSHPHCCESRHGCYLQGRHRALGCSSPEQHLVSSLGDCFVWHGMGFTVWWGAHGLYHCPAQRFNSESFWRTRSFVDWSGSQRCCRTCWSCCRGRLANWRWRCGCLLHL
ncbi:uncharacterized protein LOC9648677 isoform X2 [Selaginella moellendorffii]|uniref:uncharacterized protein LOC9648677 isoform X2 n=1 Tax=Selaginella moellendorffii TaxID=88036 RepID=UPI000D1CD996|nr:uncharacterized protein LOC9648677 isoform X2 [Selaginella moellendorffii]|eukprot:XP_024536994.1 uncharacterized protein LOC9648677 isoform X2 [Selaginella moellendorffii]